MLALYEWRIFHSLNSPTIKPMNSTNLSQAVNLNDVYIFILKNSHEKYKVCKFPIPLFLASSGRECNFWFLSFFVHGDYRYLSFSCIFILFSYIIPQFVCNHHYRYPGKEGLKMLIHLVFKVGRALQPSVYHIDNCELMFKKKVPKTDPVK